MRSKKVLFILVIASLVILSGCTAKDTGPSQTGNTSDEEKPSSGTAKERPTPGSVNAIHFNKLIEFLPPSPSGWTADKPQGFMNTVETGSWSMANEEYSKGDTARANVGIMDSAYYDVGWFSAWEGIYNYESTEGYAKTTTIKGYPGFESYTKSSNQYVLYVNVKERFMIYITVDGADRETMSTFANAIDYAGIAALT